MSSTEQSDLEQTIAEIELQEKQRQKEVASKVAAIKLRLATLKSSNVPITTMEQLQQSQSTRVETTPKKADTTREDESLTPGVSPFASQHLSRTISPIRHSPGGSATSRSDASRLSERQHRLEKPFYARVVPDKGLKGEELFKAHDRIKAEAQRRGVAIDPFRKSSGAALVSIASMVHDASLPSNVILDILPALTDARAREDVSILIEDIIAQTSDTATALDTLAAELAAITTRRRFDAMASAMAAVTTASAFTRTDQDLRAHAVGLENALADLLHLTGETLSAVDARLFIAAGITAGLPPTIPVCLELQRDAMQAHAAGCPITAAYVLRWLRENEETFKYQAEFALATRANQRPAQPQQQQRQPQNQRGSQSANARPTDRRGPTANVRAVFNDDDLEPVGEGAIVLHNSAAAACPCDPAKRCHEPGPACRAKCAHPTCVERGLPHANDSCFRQNPSARPSHFDTRRN